MRRLIAGLLILSLLPLSGCSFKSEKSFEDIHSEIAKGDKDEALKDLLEILNNDNDPKRTLEAARIGSQLAHFQMKRYDAALSFYLHLANYSPDLNEKISSLKYLTQIMIDHARDYERAVETLEKLLTMDLSREEKFQYRLQLAKANYQLARVDQAQAELDVLKEQKNIGGLAYDIKLFQSNIYVSEKKHDEAARILKDLIRDFPARAKVDGLQLNLVSTYEDSNDLDSAITAMEEMKEDYPDTQFLEVRISRLKERIKNKPGAKGLKK